MSGFNLSHIARLARLRFKEGELKTFEPQIAGILKFVEELKGVDVTGVEPTSHPLPMSNVFRPDTVIPSLPIEELLKQAPRARGRFFEVPKVIDSASSE